MNTFEWILGWIPHFIETERGFHRYYYRLFDPSPASVSFASSSPMFDWIRYGYLPKAKGMYHTRQGNWHVVLERRK